MNSTTIQIISRRLLQAADIDAFNGIPETSPAAAAAAPSRRIFDPTASFDSSMALTILILLTALFFLAFFSIYLRRFSSVEITSPPPRAKGSGGLDSSAVNSLPLVAHGKQRMNEECSICLSEFSEGETVKLIPYCAHVFHPTCIDTWLASHVTCPVCRSAKLLHTAEEVCSDVAHHKVGES